MGKVRRFLSIVFGWSQMGGKSEFFLSTHDSGGGIAVHFSFGCPAINHVLVKGF